MGSQSWTQLSDSECNTEVGLTQVWFLGFLHCRLILYHLSHQGSSQRPWKSLESVKAKEGPSMTFSFHCSWKGARMSTNQTCSDINQVTLLRNEQPVPGSRKSLGDSSRIFSRGGKLHLVDNWTGRHLWSFLILQILIFPLVCPPCSTVGYKTQRFENSCTTIHSGQ